jgi:hypothetical protein
MAAEKPPIRITKQRAQAFLKAADRGIDEWKAELKENYGVVFTRDGMIELDEESFALLTAEEQGIVLEILDDLERAIDTLAIFRRRYG